MTLEAARPTAPKIGPGQGSGVMPFMVIYRTTDGSSRYEQADAIDEAALFVERLRNSEGIDQIRIYRMEEISFAFRPYYKVELGLPERQTAPPADAADSTTPTEVPEAPAEPVAEAAADAADTEVALDAAPRWRTPSLSTPLRRPDRGPVLPPPPVATASRGRQRSTRVVRALSVRILASAHPSAWSNTEASASATSPKAAATATPSPARNRPSRHAERRRSHHGRSSCSTTSVISTVSTSRAAT